MITSPVTASSKASTAIYAALTAAASLRLMSPAPSILTPRGSTAPARSWEGSSRAGRRSPFVETPTAASPRSMSLVPAAAGRRDQRFRPDRGQLYGQYVVHDARLSAQP